MTSPGKTPNGQTLRATLWLALAVFLAPPSFAQSAADRRPERNRGAVLHADEPPPPPRILEDERAREHSGARARRPAEAPSGVPSPASGAATPASGAAAPLGETTPLGETPFQARLAPPAEGRNDDLEEVIVVGKSSALHLPDLGSSLRSAREAERDQGRIRVTFLPLYDPVTESGPGADSLFGNREMQRVGFINLFRIRFGPRRDD